MAATGPPGPGGDLGVIGIARQGRAVPVRQAHGPSQHGEDGLTGGQGLGESLPAPSPERVFMPTASAMSSRYHASAATSV